MVTITLPVFQYAYTHTHHHTQLIKASLFSSPNPNKPGLAAHGGFHISLPLARVDSKCLKLASALGTGLKRRFRCRGQQIITVGVLEWPCRTLEMILTHFCWRVLQRVYSQMKWRARPWWDGESLMLPFSGGLIKPKKKKTNREKNNSWTQHWAQDGKQKEKGWDRMRVHWWE